ncbi:sulfurtransferase [Microbulbifer spongiae]|uniref:Sulfurtransferase n=1 Tax=Microbulbifer spongiae TaxID=2944933 RepID=A0ABY9E723_9GAMM|nr:sulfurtransferase [Microbulbifer sp. MI-G]WKD48265.1 sulfurtransferase [Microbulbifer sp. MI-G]
MEKNSDDPLIEVAALTRLQACADPVILDCRYALSDPDKGARAFANGHIPGAHYASLHRDLSAPLQRYGGRHPLPSSAQFQQLARKLGVCRTTPVVVYDDNRLGFAARAWFLFFFFGHKSIHILNGGLQAWKDAGQPLETRAPAPRPAGDFKPEPQENLLVHYAQVKAGLHTASWQLVDARDRERFAGLKESIDPIAGHIPTAINSPWQEITETASGKVKSPEALRKQWESLSNGRPLLNYCGSGVTACVNFFAQYLAGRRNSLLYPGSWSDWCAHQRGRH